jgi:signal transduction histidine kinase/CheY-like chemotaxis protein
MNQQLLSVKTWFYIFLLALLMVIAISEVVSQYFLSIPNDDVANISLVGKQISNSQRIAKLVLNFERDVHHGRESRNRLDTLQRVSAIWASEFDSLRMQTKNSNNEITTRLNQNDSIVKIISDAIQGLQPQPDSSSLSRSIKLIQKHELAFLIQIHELELGLRQEEEQRMASLRQFNFWIEPLAILILTIGFAVIFYPLIKQQQKLNMLHEKSLEDLRESDQVKENFLSIISHEIRTPLNSVIGLSNLLIRRNPREDQVEIVKTLKNSADNLMHLVNDILDFNKIKAGKIELEYTVFSFQEFLHQLHAMFSTVASDKGLELKILADPRVPDLLESDVGRLNQIFNNLLSNAIKFTHQGQVDLEANLISVVGHTCKIVIAVSDNGIGIPADKIDSIFLPFQQGSIDVSRKYGGTGLGLTIVHSLVQLFNGKITLTSAPQKGTRFSIELDFKIAQHEGSYATAIKPTTVAAKTANLSSILYVEDVPSNRLLVKSILTDNGFGCSTANSGKAALKITATKKFDLILMDIQMPVMDGYSVAEAIRNQKTGKNKTTPIVAFTAEPYSEQLKVKMLKHRFHDLMTKPFDIETFLEKITHFINGKAKNEELISFAFYEYAFSNDPKQLNEIKLAVIKDLKGFEKDFLTKSKREDLRGMREEIHRIRPIVKNLKCSELTMVFDNFRLHENHSIALTKLVNQIAELVERMVGEIETLKY